MFVPMAPRLDLDRAIPCGHESFKLGDHIVVCQDGSIVKLEKEKPNMAMKGLISWSMGMPAIDVTTTTSRHRPTLVPARYITLELQVEVDSEAHREALLFRDRLTGAFAPTGKAGE